MIGILRHLRTHTRTGTVAVAVLVALALAGGLLTTAQDRDGGQAWIRLFFDRDGDGMRAPDDPPLTRDAVVELLDSAGVVIASALLDDAPYAGQGLVGFQFLAPGRYSIRISGGELLATTADRFDVMIDGNGIPPVVEYGARAFTLDGALGASTNGFTPNPQIIRLTLASLGTIITLTVMAILGVVVYAVFFRPRGAG